MTPEFILKASLCREPNCGNYSQQDRLSEIENMGHANEYAEPGYTQPKCGILFANWNLFPSGIDSILESYGYSIEWSDEWATCSNCNKAVRTSADSYGWQPSYAIVNDCELLCNDCLANDAESYLEGLEDNPNTALNLPKINPADYGYVMLQDSFESGFHPGQTDDPKKILAVLQDQGKTRILFRVDSVGQFDVSFSVWQKTEDSEDGE